MPLTELLPFKLHLIQLGGGLTDGLVKNTVLLLHVFDAGLCSDLAALTQR